MIRPFYAFIGLRYTRAKRRNHFISFMSLTSMLGILIGVAALITVISVMNGFTREITNQMLSVVPHILVQSPESNFSDWQPLLTDLQKHPKVKAAVPYVADQGMLVHSGRVEGVIIRGVYPKQIGLVYPLESKLVAGDYAQLQPGSFGIILSQEMANTMGAWLGDQISLIVPEAKVTLAGVLPRLKRFEVIGIFESGSIYDNRHIFIDIEDARKLLRMKDSISAIQLKIENKLDAPLIAKDISQKIGPDYILQDWTQRFAGYFDALRMEKTVMWCILILIIAVAAFNLVSSLVMLVTDKRSDIAILRTMGATKTHVMAIFMLQGSLIGFIGTLLGVLAGVLLAFNVTDLVEKVQQLLHVQLISKDVYFIGYLPSEVHLQDIFVVCLISLCLSFVATIFPAWRASNIQPAEALRYE